MGSNLTNGGERVPLAQEQLLASLTERQREAVEHVDGPQLILAGPGSGKTRVVTHRIAYLLHEGIPAESIIALTFTNKAADEMRQRVERLCPGRGVWMGTFHRFCARQLRRHAALVGLRENYSIYDADDSLKLLREAIDDADVELVQESPGRIATAISWAKNDLIAPEDYVAAPGNPVGFLVQRIYPHYQRRLLAANAVDFDDLLMHMAVLLRENPELRRALDARFRYIMVDEYQDTNFAQYALVRAMSIDHPNLSVTGDPDQSIYGWRGATIRNILEFEHDFAGVHVVRLEENFRSTRLILRAADVLIGNNVHRKEKTLRTGNPDGHPVRIVVYPTGWQEADAIAARIANDVAAGRRRYRDHAVFYRTNAISRVLERSLRTLAIPYQVVRGLEFYQRKEVKDILAYLHLLNNPANDVALLRVINTPPRKIGKTTIQRLVTHARTRHLSLLEAARQSGMIESLSKRSAVEVARFVALIDALRSRGDEKVEPVTREAILQSGYRQWLESSQHAEDQQRLENLDELLSDTREFDEAHPDDGGLEAFLEQASLITDIDDWQVEPDCVALMTLHAAKGLEFPVVFIVAVEDELLPHARSREDPDQLEEERRLLFVGMTRAKEELHLSAAQQRTIQGMREYRVTSPFLMELPRDEMEVLGELGYSSYCPEQDVEDGDGYYEAPDWDADESAQVEAGDWEYNMPRRRRPSPPRRQHKKQRRSTSSMREETVPTAGDASLVRAADMLADPAASSPCEPQAFRRGMVVIHAQYGLGKILTLHGSGKRRSATVQFAGENRPRSFQLAFSNLRPIGD